MSNILNNIQKSTPGTGSEGDFDHLFEDLDLASTKLGRSEEAKNTLIAKVLGQLDTIDFQLKDANSEVLGDAYEYLIGRFASGACNSFTKRCSRRTSISKRPGSIRSLMGKIVLTPTNGRIEIDVRGGLAGILTPSIQTKTPAFRAGASHIRLVAGAGFEPATYGL